MDKEVKSGMKLRERIERSVADIEKQGRKTKQHRWRIKYCHILSQLDL